MTTDVAVERGVTPQKVMIAAWIALAAVALIGVQVFLYRGVDVPAMVIGIVAVSGAVLTSTGRRWALITSMVFAALLTLFDLPIFLQRLARPEQIGWFTVSLLGLTCYATIITAGVRSLRHDRRGA